EPIHDGGHVAPEATGDEDVQQTDTLGGAVPEVMGHAGRDAPEGPVRRLQPVLSAKRADRAGADIAGPAIAPMRVRPRAVGAGLQPAFRGAVARSRLVLVGLEYRRHPAEFIAPPLAGRQMQDALAGVIVAHCRLPVAGGK